jgi:hypothetical protein
MITHAIAFLLGWSAGAAVIYLLFWITEDDGSS